MADGTRGPSGPAFLAGLFDLTGGVALVTGASSGIGRRMAGALARAGADVVLVARSADLLAGAVAEVSAYGGGRAAFLTADLSDRAAVAPLAERAAGVFGAPDILVNAAGINPRRPVDDVDWDTWDLTLDLNLAVPFFLAKALVPGMKEKGQGKGRGAIINIASMQSFRAFTNGLPYGASKGGVVQLTRAMAEAWSPQGVTANAIAPGFFPTPLTKAVFDDPAMAAHHARMTAIGRNGEMADLDGVTVFLAAPASAYITGQVIPVDGGYTAK